MIRKAFSEVAANFYKNSEQRIQNTVIDVS